MSFQEIYIIWEQWPMSLSHSISQQWISAELQGFSLDWWSSATDWMSTNSSVGRKGGKTGKEWYNRKRTHTKKSHDLQGFYIQNVVPVSLI